MIHAHGSGRRGKGAGTRIGAIMAAIMFVLAVFLLVKGGWGVLVPFGFALIIFGVIMAFVRAVGRPHR